MERLIAALAAGGLFGAGLFVSGMTQTAKVQGWLDIFGDWDPTLAFVLGGAILPMALAWRVAARRTSSVLGHPLPPPARTGIDPALVTGSVLFGAGWALAGLCPGPAIASLSYGGQGGLVFLLAMASGMLAAPIARRWLDAKPAPLRSQGLTMDIRALTESYAVSPQITLADLPAIKAAGYTTVIDNRPDGEIPGDLHTPHIKAAAQALGLTFVANPIIGGAMTMANVEAQRAAIAASSGPVFAYCASGNRSSVVWALAHAGHRPTDELIAIPARFGYQLEGVRGQIDALAAKA
jgi:uncharacterized protein (TIGR01244 family)